MHDTMNAINKSRFSNAIRELYNYNHAIDNAVYWVNLINEDCPKVNVIKRLLNKTNNHIKNTFAFVEEYADIDDADIDNTGMESALLKTLYPKCDEPVMVNNDAGFKHFKINLKNLKAANQSIDIAYALWKVGLFRTRSISVVYNDDEHIAYIEVDSYCNTEGAYDLIEHMKHYDVLLINYDESDNEKWFMLEKNNHYNNLHSKLPKKFKNQLTYFGTTTVFDDKFYEDYEDCKEQPCDHKDVVVSETNLYVLKSRLESLTQFSPEVVKLEEEIQYIEHMLTNKKN
jgi:hypothetical protein